mgnify:CR=1 FL=1
MTGVQTCALPICSSNCQLVPRVVSSSSKRLSESVDESASVWNVLGMAEKEVAEPVESSSEPLGDSVRRAKATGESRSLACEEIDPRRGKLEAIGRLAVSLAYRFVCALHKSRVSSLDRGCVHGTTRTGWRSGWSCCRHRDSGRSLEERGEHFSVDPDEERNALVTTSTKPLREAILCLRLVGVVSLDCCSARIVSATALSGAS